MAKELEQMMGELPNNSLDSANAQKNEDAGSPREDEVSMIVEPLQDPKGMSSIVRFEDNSQALPRRVKKLMEELTRKIMQVSLFLCTDMKISPIEVMSWFLNAHRETDVHHTTKVGKIIALGVTKDRQLLLDVPTIPIASWATHKLVEFLIAPKTKSQDFGIVVYHLMCNISYIKPDGCLNVNIGIAMADNFCGASTIVGKASRVVFLDTATQPVILF